MGAFERARDPSVVQLPERYSDMERPWMRKNLDNAKLYQSEVASHNWMRMKTLRVSGLGSVTVGDVISQLESHGCLFVAWGGAVRDALLGRIPEDIDGEVSCPLAQATNWCKIPFGNNNCAGSMPGNHVRPLAIGSKNNLTRRDAIESDIMHIAPWNNRLGGPLVTWEFAANSLGFINDSEGNTYLMDLTGKGLNDTCSLNIDIPVRMEDSAAWICSRDCYSLLRYYKLRLNGFSPANDNLTTMLSDRIRQICSAPTIRFFHCNAVIEGSMEDHRSDTTENDDLTSTCVVTALDEKTANRIQAFKQLLKEDFGDYYSQTIEKAISMMELRVLEDDEPSSNIENDSNGSTLDHGYVSAVSVCLMLITARAFLM